MYKKLLTSIAILIIGIFSFTVCFANNGLEDVANDVRNVVGGAENAVEDAAKDISNTSKDITGGIENGANNMANDIMNNNNDNTKTSMKNNNYTATRTSTTGNTLMGMNATAWTWLIIGIATIAIVALVWYYSMQIRSSEYNSKD